MLDYGWRVGGTVLNTSKEGGTEQRGVEAKILKRGGQARSKDGCLKKGVAGTPLILRNNSNPYEINKPQKLV